MTQAPNWLDHNLRELLRRAWVPAPCREEFRTELERKVVALVVARHGAGSRAARHGGTFLLVAAVVVGALGIAWWIAQDAGSGDAPRSPVDPSARAMGPQRPGGTAAPAAASGRIEVRVVDERSRPIAGVSVELLGAFDGPIPGVAPAVTDEAGACTLEVAPSGACRVRARSEGAGDAEARSEVRAGETTTVLLILRGR